MTIIAVVPVMRADAATAWPWLPVEKASTPAARSASVSESRVLSAPRILKEPVSCNASALTSTRAPVSSSSIGEERRGVRRTRPSSRCAAARMVSIPKSMGAILPWPRPRADRAQSRGLPPRSSSIVVIVRVSAVWDSMIEVARTSTASFLLWSRPTSAMGTPASWWRIISWR